MHASISKTPTSEETFQILLDVMEQHFAALKLPDLDSEHKLTRAVSFSELPSTRKIIIEQCYQSPHAPGIVRQYSCEQIFDKAANTREVKISEVVKTCNSEQKNRWTTTFPYINTVNASDWNSPASSNLAIEKPRENEVERMDVDADPLDVKQLETALYNIAPSECEKIPLPNGVKECAESYNDKQNQLSNIENDKTKSTGSTDCFTIGDNTAYENFKLKYRPLVPPQTPTEYKKRMSCSFWKVIFFVLLPITALIIAGIYNYEEHGPMVVCSHSSDFFNATIELQEKVFGQRQAILSLSQSLIRDTPCIKLIALVGGTGIGKSYSVDIIIRNFPRPYFIYQYYSPLTDQFLNKEFWPFTCNLVVLENLDKKDLSYIATYWRKLQHKENHCVTMLAVFNMEEVNSELERSVDLNRDLTELEKAFDREQIKVDIIPYEHLNEDTLEKCVATAAKDSGINLNPSQIQEVKRGLLLTNTGCKGAYSKVQLFKLGQT